MEFSSFPFPLKEVGEGDLKLVSNAGICPFCEKESIDELPPRTPPYYHYQCRICKKVFVIEKKET